MVDQILDSHAYETTEEEVKLSGFRLRIAALILDGVFAIALAIISFATGVFDLLLDFGTKYLPFLVVILLIRLLGLAIVSAAFESSTIQGTPGQVLPQDTCSR